MRTGRKVTYSVVELALVVFAFATVVHGVRSRVSTLQERSDVIDVILEGRFKTFRRE